MKTQEEIEEMANDFVSLAFSRQDLYDGFINGYFQCQQDMAEKYTEQDMVKFAFDTYYQEDMAKKYTEEDMLKCWNTAFTDAMNIDSETYKPIFYSDFIKSLNKQD